ncbi:uncharacterized protein [Argopecten irradians]|uniref:uncharacterized protein n=1 Tax=Argopecten irradians TaxID=31199 RepID=UPI00371E86FC
MEGEAPVGSMEDEASVGSMEGEAPIGSMEGEAPQKLTGHLTVDSCTSSKLKLTLENAADGGIIYIQGQTSACKQTTSSASTVHEFDFASCGIAWADSFKMIVQKKALYQTGDDKQIPIMCIMDLTDLTVANNLNALDKDDDAGQNLTVKPTASMKLYRAGIDIGGSNVKLTDVITMSIELDPEFRDDFDIVAKDCTAATIPIINSKCAADVDLFPDFAKPQQGYLVSSFGAFRTTDLNGGSVAMTFSCTLTVCANMCSAVCSYSLSRHMFRFQKLFCFANRLEALTYYISLFRIS